jgi:hypothetical protein
LGTTSRSIRWVEHVEGTNNMKNTYRFLVGNEEGKRTVKRPRHTWKTILTHTINRLD